MSAPFRNRFRFSLRTFLIICVLPVPFFAWLANLKIKAVRQREALIYFQSRGMQAGLDDLSPSIPTAVRNFFAAIDSHILYRVIYLQSSQPLNGRDFERLEHLHGLRNLHFNQNGATDRENEYCICDRDMERLTSIKSLASITLDTPLTADRLRGIPSLPELDSLMLPRAKLDTAFLERLSQKPKMAALEFNGSDLSPDSLAKLARLPLLQTLVIHDLAPNSLRGLAECHAVTGLGLYSCKLSVADAEAIGVMRFRTFDLVNPVIEKGFFQKLKHHPSLVRITVQNGDVYFSTSTTAKAQGPIALAELEYCEDHFTTDKGEGDGK